MMPKKSVWDLESGLNIQKHDESTDNVKTNSSSYRSDNSESPTILSLTSSDGVLTSPSTKLGDDADSEFG